MTLHKPFASRRPRKGSAGSRPSPTQPRFPQRREFLALPLARRREILKAQALAARVHYGQASDWREWEAADLTSQTNE